LVTRAPFGCGFPHLVELGEEVIHLRTLGRTVTITFAHALGGLLLTVSIYAFVDGLTKLLKLCFLLLNDGFSIFSL
jgi:hypothetical protein